MNIEIFFEIHRLYFQLQRIKAAILLVSYTRGLPMSCKCFFCQNNFMKYFCGSISLLWPLKDRNFKSESMMWKAKKKKTWFCGNVLFYHSYIAHLKGKQVWGNLLCGGNMHIMIFDSKGLGRAKKKNRKKIKILSVCCFCWNWESVFQMFQVSVSLYCLGFPRCSHLSV